jgi:hypothetical protein
MTGKLTEFAVCVCVGRVQVIGKEEEHSRQGKERARLPGVTVYFRCVSRNWRSLCKAGLS